MEHMIHSLFLLLFSSLLSFAAYAAYEPLPEDFTKVSLVIAQAADKMESKFGHSFLRFSRDDKYNTLEDMAVEFGADLEGNGISYLRGIGIGPGYSFDVKPSPFQTIWLSNTHVQERDLYHYDLNLTPEEVKGLIQNLNEYIVGEKKVTYNFFTRNCSTQVVELLNSVTSDKIGGLSKNVPVWLPEKLKELGLIRSEFTVPSIKTLRDEVINKAFERSIANLHHPYLENLRDQLTGEFHQRMVGYIKMAELAKLYPQAAFKLQSFIKRMSSNELLSARMDILRLANKEFSGMYQIASLSHHGQIKSVEADMIKALQRGHYQTAFTQKDGVVLFKLKAKIKCSKNNTCEYATYSFTHKKLRMAENEQFFELNGYPVFYSGDHGSFKKMIDERMTIVPEVVTINGKKVIMPLIIQDFANTDKTNLKGMSVINDSNKANPFGMCAGFSQVQRKLMANVFFRPDSEKKSQSYYNEVILSALSGKQTFAYGVSNISELTALADETLLTDLISTYSSNYNQFLKLSIEWFKSKKLSLESIPDIKYMTSKGLYPLMTFRPFEDVRIEHMMVIYGVKDLGDQFQLMVYDPNIGLVPHDYVIKYFINKQDMSLSSNFYKKIDKNHVPTIK